MATVHDLPVELLLEIFVSCLIPVSCVQDAILVRLAAAAAPLLLAQVSQKWRALCLASPSLWCNVRAHFRNCESSTSTNEISTDHLLELWLRRAACRPIHLDVHTVSTPNLVHLLRNFPTIQRLCVRIDRFSPRQSAHTGALTLPALQTLFVSEYESPYRKFAEVLVAPNLREVHSPDSGSNKYTAAGLSSLVSRSACGATVTKLTIGTAGATDELLDLLRAAPGVEHLHLDDGAWKRYDWDLQRPPSFTHLLCLDGNLPRLRTLTIDCLLPKERFADFLLVLERRKTTLSVVRLNLLHESIRYQSRHSANVFAGAEVRAGLGALVSAGLDLLITTRENMPWPHKTDRCYHRSKDDWVGEWCFGPPYGVMSH